MNEAILKLLNANEIINEKLPMITEAFLSFYGESQRERITNILKNMQIITYCKPEDMNEIIEYTEIKKLEELTNELLNKININNLDKEKLKEILFDNITEYDCISTLDSYNDYLFGDKERLPEVIDLLKNFYPNINETNIDELISKNTFKELDNILVLYNELLEEYEKFILSTRTYKEYLKKCHQTRDILSKKYLKKILSKLKEELPHEEFLKIEKEYNLIIELSTNEDIDTQNIYLNKDLTPSLIESFAEKYDKLLENSDKETKECIQNLRMLYFKKIGLNLGDNYIEYIKNNEPKKLVPSKKTIELLTRLREKLYIEMKTEYYRSLPEYQINREIIDSLELLDKDDGYNVYAYEGNLTTTIPNIKIINNQYKIFSLVLLYLGTTEEYIDHFIIHELNHAIETSLKSFDGKNYQIIAGWEIFTGNIQEIPDQENYYFEEGKREYELLNETINEMISQEITNILFSSNNYIINNSENALIKNGTNYEHTKFIVEEFYETYKQAIIDSRNNGNIQIIYDEVGESNFKDLNKLFHLYYENFPGETIYDLYDELDKGIESNKTKIYQDITNQRDIILSNMKKYKNKSKKRTISV